MTVLINHTILKLLIIVVTVMFVSVGQILFKYTSLLIGSGHPLFGIRVLAVIILAFFISGCGSLIYIGLLSSMNLSNAYPFMALTFIAVPLLSVAVYGDKLNTHYFLGISLIISGIVVVARSA